MCGNLLESLRELVDPKRLEHSIGVSDTAYKLAMHYGEDIEQARVAGLIHDCAKCLSLEKMHKLLDEYKTSIDESFTGSVALLHGPLGAEIAKRQFNISDPEILEAVAIHTTGKAGMSQLDKIVCLADYIEPSRKYPGVDNIRLFAYKDLNVALLKAFDSSIKAIISKGRMLHPKTVEARNDLINKIRNNNNKT